MNRRSFLSAALLAPFIARQGSRGARFVGVMPLGSAGGGLAPPFGRLLGDGLDARLFADLSQLGGSQSARDNQPASDDQSAIGSQSAIRNQSAIRPSRASGRPEPVEGRSPQSALVTPNDSFFVRTAFPSTLTRTDPWSIRVGGLVDKPVDINLRDLEAQIGPSQRVLLECSGNADQSNYGLMSAADWEGIPLAAVVERMRPARGARILVSGVDDDSRKWRTSIAGASWIFSRDDLQRAVLAVRMNGAPLPRDHGAPVRLIVPGWYGCACIKWVERIDIVADDAPATSQMLEFAARTHQPFDSREIEGSLRARPFESREIERSLGARPFDASEIQRSLGAQPFDASEIERSLGAPPFESPDVERSPKARPFDASNAPGASGAKSTDDSRDVERPLGVRPALLARDFIPAVIDTAAMPVRVEKWIAGGRAEYRITGIIWGGSKPTNALSIRFKSGTPWVRVDDCPLPQSTLTWSLWTHTWRPAEPGRYQIVLRVDDPTIRTRRLDVFFYVREIQIDDV
jgi:DMSO/TMAO reductase YedYZ molybdopterin-dependent catalytic subunit